MTPADIRKKEFRRSVRGYLDEDVDVFLDEVADELERVVKLNKELQEKVKSLEEQVSGHADIREALEKTLVAAQLQSEEIRSKAQKESQSMLREAEAKAKIVVDDFYAKTRAVQQTLMQLKLLEEDFRFKFKGMLEGYLQLLEKGPLVVLEGGTAADGVPPVSGSDSTEFKGAADGESPDSDDSPTSETTQTGAASAGDGGVEPASASTEPAANLSHPPGVEGAQRETDIAEDLTVETRPEARLAQSETGRVASGSATSQRGSGVYFGTAAADSDDPFPEIGGDPAQPRDFRW